MDADLRDDSASQNKAVSAELERDLDYLREVVRRAEPTSAPRSILYLWAALGLLGFSLIDLAPQFVGSFWLVAAPLGLVVSLWLGIRQARLEGQVSREQNRRHIQHWSGLLGAELLVAAFIWRGMLVGKGIALVFLLLVSIAYWFAGVHLMPRFRTLGVLTALITLALTLVNLPYMWTLAGVVLAAGLVIAAHGGSTEHGQA